MTREIGTARLVLSALGEADADELHAVLDDVGLHTFIGGAPPTAAAWRERVRRWQDERSPDGSERWLNWIARTREGGVAVAHLQATVHTGVAGGQDPEPSADTATGPGPGADTTTGPGQCADTATGPGPGTDTTTGPGAATTADVAWVVGTVHQGRGYATEAARALCGWLRHDGGVEVVTAHVHPGHIASQRVAAACGLRDTGLVDGDGEAVWSSA